MEEVENKSLIVPQVKEGLYTFPFKGLIVLMLISTHGINHLLADSDRRLPHGLGRWVLTEDKPEIYMEKVTGLINHQVFKVAITHSHQVGNCTVPCTGFDIDIKDLFVLLFIEDLLCDLFIIDNLMYLMCAFSLKEFSNATPILLNNVLDRV